MIETIGTRTAAQLWASELESLAQETQRPEGSVTVEEFAEMAAMGPQAASAHLNRLVAQGRADRVERRIKDRHGRSRVTALFTLKNPTHPPRSGRGVVTKTTTKKTR